MVAVHTSQLMAILDELERGFGPHPELYDTRAEFLDDPEQRMRLYEQALALAREKGDDEVEAEMRESMADLPGEPAPWRAVASDREGKRKRRNTGLSA